MKTPVPHQNDESAPAAPADPADPSPDWPSITHVVECPLCEYNLYGLTQPRCPECGLDFEWLTVLNPDRQRHPYLFEHYPQSNSASFFKTLGGGLRPKRFWTTLHPVQRSAPWRLVIYAMIVFALAIAPIVLAPLLLSAPTRGNYLSNTARFEFMVKFLREFPLLLLSRFFYAPVYKTLPYLAIAWTLIPFLDYLLLLIFQGTMQRVRVRHHHVLRCIIYSSDILIWSSLLLCVMLCANSVMRGDLDEWLAWAVIFLFPFNWIVLTWRLMVAYRRYLRFHHAEVAVLSVQVIIFLLAMFGLLAIRNW